MALLDENARKLIEVQSTLERNDKDMIGQLILDFKSQHTQISNSVGQSELCHVKIQ